MLDPEDLNEITRAYYDICSEAIHRFDGIIANYIGDGIMALFGYPRAHEDDAERAIHAGLSLIRTLETSSIFTGRGVSARVGIATGLVVVGSHGADPLTPEKTVVGETPNFAAHLQAAIKPNAVVISTATRRLIGDVFTLAEMELGSFKGADKPVTAWQVIGEKTAPSRFAAHVTSLTGFVGRDQEIALLSDRWQLAVQGEGQVVLLAGEAGIGKSRIVEMFRCLNAAKPHIAIHYQCSPYHGDSALYPVIAQIEAAAGIAVDDLPTTRLDKLEALHKRTTDRSDDVIPLFAALLSIPTGDRYPPPDPDPQRRRERTLAAMIQELEGLAGQSAVLMILEDAHWADPTTLDLVGRINLQIPNLRIFLIVTYRTGFAIPWDHSHVTTLVLNKLGRRHCRDMVASITQGKALPPEVMEQIIAKTDGIPLFVEELTKAVLESGLLTEQADAWLLSGLLPPLAIPDTLQDSLMARLDRLSAVKEVAQIGATIGREFSVDLLAAVSAMSLADLRDALAKLETSGLIFSRGPPNSMFIFKHALVQDAAYQTLLKSKRQLLHARIANALETRFAEVAQTQPEIVAHHYTNAGAAQTAVKWWLKAGQLAIKRSANLEAVSHLSRAIEQVRICPESRERDTSELAIRISLSGPLIATRGYVTPELAQNYARASELCSRLGEDKYTFPVMYGQWVIPYVRGDMATALTISKTFLRLAEFSLTSASR